MTEEERQRHIAQLARVLDEAEFTANHEDTDQEHQRIAQGDVDALTAAIAALQREGEMEAQSRTLRKELDTVADRLGETVQENVRLRLEIKELKAAITKAAAEGLSQ